MINRELLHPASIAVIGASNNIQKPGGKVLFNVIAGGFQGPIYPVNPRENEVQGIRSFRQVGDLPEVEFAILAIPAAACLAAVKTLAETKNTKAFVILSAGFSEENEEGTAIEREIVEIVAAHNGSLIGPNCIGVITPGCSAVFTTPVPGFVPQGCDFVSGSGATAVFIMETGIPKGLAFAHVFSVGNSAQIGVEEVLEFLDESFDPRTSSKVKILYLESVKNPHKLLVHAQSLIAKGCRIAAIKAGSSSAGSRAASSHTGALAGSDAAVDALFRKAGIIRCFSREELATVAGVLTYPALLGKRFAVITHAGGPAVMLTDALSHGGLEIPPIEEDQAAAIKEKLFAGSSAANPIDFLATGTAEQLAAIIDFCNSEVKIVDAMVVIFGSPGLSSVAAPYRVIQEKIRSGGKPIFPVLPSAINAQKEIEAFRESGIPFFSDEVSLARALALVQSTPPPDRTDPVAGIVDTVRVRAVVNSAENGYLPTSQVCELLDAAGIPRIPEHAVKNASAAIDAAKIFGYPLVAKVIGPLHKSDVGGVIVGIRDDIHLEQSFQRLMEIPDATGVLLQPLVSGVELFAGVKAEREFGHLILAGLGGVYVETLKDIQCRLAPLSRSAAGEMIKSLRSYPIIAGVRGSQGVDEELLCDILGRMSELTVAAPEIAEMDLNPLVGTASEVVVVDARIRIENG